MHNVNVLIEILGVAGSLPQDVFASKLAIGEDEVTSI